ncbi:hypothetical protein [Chitinophaga barathri]|uniref:Uncharacterized protein n=1 Tax=Chitinophaga barathri TaxID=1647451 RepID=A0A3N4MJS9_9BACT|nr:hypothetical protein [Chitinophaga barathri]RPD39849.1 hypothetical protein EG028_17120 [Chitinophaga barathri]
MAKQEGLIKIRGTIENITFYEMNGEHYARKKSTLSGKRVKTAPEFALTRVYSQIMALASKTAKTIYRSLPEEERDVALYRKMVGAGQRLLKNGCAEERLEEELRKIFVPVAEVTTNPQRPAIMVNVQGRLEGTQTKMIQLTDDPIFRVIPYIYHLNFTQPIPT